MGPGDYWLLFRVRKGDRDACCELIRRHHAGVYAYLRRLARNSDLAEDLTQDTYAKAWVHVRSLRRCTSLRAWLLAIARNEYLQWLRHRREEQGLPDDLAEVPSREPDAEKTVLTDERRRLLRSAVNGLAPDLQEAVGLHYFQDLSLREAAEVLGVPTGTVKSRLNRALGELRARFAEDRTHERSKADRATA